MSNWWMNCDDEMAQFGFNPKTMMAVEVCGRCTIIESVSSVAQDLSTRIRNNRENKSEGIYERIVANKYIGRRYGIFR